MYRDEELPKAICDTCYDLITKYSEFKRTCIRSQHTLTNFKNNIKCETDELTANSIESQEDKVKTDMVTGSIKLEESQEYVNGKLFKTKLVICPINFNRFIIMAWGTDYFSFITSFCCLNTGHTVRYNI